jgi:hypothetical protein
MPQEINLNKSKDKSEHCVDAEKVAAVERKLRHFRGVAASVLRDALDVLGDIWNACEDTRTPEEILDGKEFPSDRLPACGWTELLEKLHLLRRYVEYAKSLCDGSFDNGKKQGER